MDDYFDCGNEHEHAHSEATAERRYCDAEGYDGSAGDGNGAVGSGDFQCNTGRQYRYLRMIFQKGQGRRYSLFFFCAEKVCFRRLGHIFFGRKEKRVVQMGEKAGSDMNRLLSEITGEQGQDALRMLERMERLRRLIGNTAAAEQQEKPLPLPEKKDTHPLFAGSVGENVITAAIPFLDQEYQKDLYIIVRLMEMRRVFSGGMLEAMGYTSLI